MIRSLRAFDFQANPRQVGLALAGVTALVSGISVFVNASAVRAFNDPVLFTTMKNAVAAVVLLAIAIGGPRDALRAPRSAWLGLIVLGVVGGSIPFILFFSGLAQASAPAAAVIHKTLFACVAVLAVIFLRERIGILQVAALAVLLGSQLLIQTPVGVGWGTGETMIAAATGLWAIEVVIAKRLLRAVPSPLAAAARMSFGLVVLIGFLAATGGLAGIASLGAEQWAWVLGTGLLLSAYVGTWYAALQRAPATAVTAVLTLGAPITAALQLVASGRVPAAGVALGYATGLVAALAVAWLALRPRAGTAAQQAIGPGAR
jgi:drug/metabolite transporter (DMT)-like permease